MKIAVLTPLGNSVDVEHMCCIEKLPYHITRIRFPGGNLLDQSRSALVTAGQRAKADVFVWIDSDILFAPTAPDLLASKLSNEFPIVSGLYSSKDNEENVIGFASGAEVGGLRPANRVGFGFLAMRASVFDVIGKDLPDVALMSAMGEISKPYFLPVIENGKYYGEDFSFCIRAERAGIKMAFASDVRVVHKGTKRYMVTEKSNYRQDG